MKFIDLAVQQDAIRTDLDTRIAAVLGHGQYIMGPEVRELEEVLADYVGVRECVTVSSGTEALLIALMAIGLKPGDEVITSPFTFIATAEVIVLLGGVPVFVDVDPRTANIDVSRIEAAITSRTRAIMPVSLYGQVADMAEINAIARRHGDIPVIEDAAQSFGAGYAGRRSCGLSTIGCTSFFPSKPLGCYGDGGAMFTDDAEIATAAREIRVHGQSRRYVHTRIGVGGRMDTLQCAVVLAKWPRFEWEVAERIRIGARYTELLHSTVQGARPLSLADAAGDIQGLRTLHLGAQRTNVYAQYTVLVPERDRLQARLSEMDIPTAVHYPVPLSEQPAYRDLSPAGRSLEYSNWLSRHVMSLPMGPDLTKEDQERIVAALAG